MRCFAYVGLEILILFPYLHISATHRAFSRAVLAFLSLEVPPCVLPGLQGATTTQGCCVTSPALPSTMTPHF